MKLNLSVPEMQDAQASQGRERRSELAAAPAQLPVPAEFQMLPRLRHRLLTLCLAP